MSLNIGTISLPTRRPFNWRALWILAGLQLFGNLASAPLLKATDTLSEPLYAWVVWTALSVLVIGLALYLASRTGLGAPLIEGYLEGAEIVDWTRRVVALSLMIATAGSVPFLLVNLNVNPERYPALWKLVLASVDAGVQEEIFSRLFLMSLFVWLASLVWHEPDGRPIPPVMWMAIILSGLTFGWGHIDDQISNPEFPPSLGALAAVMTVSTLFGISFGWLYWKQGLESAILAHFLVDAVGSGIVVPAYLSGNPVVQLAVVIGLILTAAISWRVLTRENTKPRARMGP